MTTTSTTREWRVQIDGRVVIVDLETLTSWIRDGKVGSTTPVQKRGLGWLEAARVPALRAYFEQEQHWQPADPPRAALYAAGGIPYADSVSPVSNYSPPPPHPPAVYRGQIVACVNHPEAPPRYVCPSCLAGYCYQCRTNQAVICRACDRICRDYDAFFKEMEMTAERAVPLGLRDLTWSIGLPMRRKGQLVALIVVYTIIQLLVVVLNAVGLYLVTLAISIIGAAILYACMCNVIRNVAHGDLDTDVLPATMQKHGFSGMAFLYLTTLVVLAGPVVLGLSLALYLELVGLGLVISGLGVLWALTYGPVAMMIAGFTRDVHSVVDVRMGFDTIARMGWDYVKCLGLYYLLILLLAIGTVPVFVIVVGLVVAAANAGIPVAMTAQVATGLAVVILSALSVHYLLATAGLLGRTLLKTGDRLDIPILA